ncbi:MULTISPECIES: hypothetical protein [Enterobacteriaceae]|uniref:hypothetical protein n=1 Tax=Enterobacteriaceae TaxID=543 RepID=UPI000D97F361|nr:MULTISPECIES: hypothetical protein [Enterobacteriaceae]SQC34796.1 Uncharacterised protein [Kluyvera cryocrescens]
MDQKEALQRYLDRVDAIEAVVRQLIDVLTPEQLSLFQDKTIREWTATEKVSPPELLETIRRTKGYAYKLSGL